jgi:hypothetical protein
MRRHDLFPYNRQYIVCLAVRTCWKIRGIAPWAAYVATAAVALLATVFAMSAASSPAHAHAQQACSICVAGNLPVESPPTTILHYAAPGQTERLAPEPSHLHFSEPSQGSASGRAPPAVFLLVADSSD